MSRRSQGLWLMAAVVRVMGIMAAFICSYVIIYTLIIERVHIYFLHYVEFTTIGNVRRVDIDLTIHSMLHPHAQWAGQLEIRTYFRFDAYGVGSDYLWQWRNNSYFKEGWFAINIAIWMALVFLVCAAIVLGVWWWRLGALSLHEERLTYAVRHVRRSAPLWYALGTLAGILCAASLVSVRFWQVVLAPRFNDNWDTRVSYNDDYLGWTISAIIGLLAALALYIFVFSARIKRCVLAEMGRCGHCGYPGSPGRPCSECGFSPPAVNSASV